MIKIAIYDIAYKIWADIPFKLLFFSKIIFVIYDQIFSIKDMSKNIRVFDKYLKNGTFTSI